VWDNHFTIEFDPDKGFVLQTQSDAILTVNREPAQTTVLRNGDSIELGAARLIFWLAEPPRRAQAWREAVVWSLLLAVSLAQVALVYWLMG
jgi:hypothetical protein